VRHSALVLTAGLAIAAPAHAQWTATSLHPAGATESHARGTFGGQQCGHATFGGAIHAGVWSGTAASWSDLHPAGATSSLALGMADGQVVGKARVNGVEHACMWTGTPPVWTDLHPGAPYVSSIALGVSGGRQVGSVDNGTGIGSIPVWWMGTAASYQVLGGSPPAQALAISSLGAVGYNTSPIFMTPRAMRFPLQLFTADPSSEAMGFGASGSRIVGYARINNINQAVLWNYPAAGVSLHPAGATYSRAKGAFADWQVGSAVIGGSSTRAVIWSGSAAVWEDLSTYVPGLVATDAAAVWADATTLYVVGDGRNPATGHDEAILWTRPLVPPCYANCDGSTIAPVLNVGDFTCFLQRFAAGDSYANCDQSTTAPVLNVGDFTCFLQRFAAGCP
jgi:hypothetical protein